MLKIYLYFAVFTIKACINAVQENSSCSEKHMNYILCYIGKTGFFIVNLVSTYSSL
jgi:hypothetical protein